EVTVIVPTRNESPNVAPLVAQVAAALAGRSAEILFGGDSDDGTPAAIARAAEAAPRAVPVPHRARGERSGGLGGAVVRGLELAAADVCIVMDGDLQHPPALLPRLLERYERGGVDVVSASRYIGGGDTEGLGTRLRVA